MSPPQDTAPTPPEETSAAESRRQALRRIATYGAVGGPLLLGLLNSEKAIAQTVV